MEKSKAKIVLEFDSDDVLNGCQDVTEETAVHLLMDSGLMAEFEDRLREKAGDIFYDLIHANDSPYTLKAISPETKVIFTWCVEDVQAERPDLTNEQAMEVLLKIKDKHDATVGVNWDVINYWADELYPKPEEEGAEEEC